MAFVYEAQRWKYPHFQEEVGPGSYNSQLKSKLKGGVISPQSISKTIKTSMNQSQVHISTESHLKVSQQKQKDHQQGQNSTQQNKSSKMLKRVQSAKPFSMISKPQTKQKPQKQQQPFTQQNFNLQITNSSHQQKKQFQNSLIKTSFTKVKKSIHSQKENDENTSVKKPFNDRNLRSAKEKSKANKTIDETQTKQNIEFFNHMFTKKPAFNQNLVKFVHNDGYQKQNIFTTGNFINNNQQPQQNFIIASGNCKIQLIKSSNISRVNSSYMKSDKFEDMQTTAIDDSLEQSMEYITDATPGPGEYNLVKQLNFTRTKVEKFGVTEQRFKHKTSTQKVLHLQIKIPEFKKSSKASQDKVAFGKNRPKTAKQVYSDALFYQNHQTIQNQCFKQLIKDRHSPGHFMSKCERFKPQKRPTYYGPDFFQTEKPEPITLPNSIFMSKVERHKRPVSPTAQLDFQGQSYKTIEKNMEKTKQRKQLLDGQVPGFYVSQPRFKYKKIEQKQQLPKGSSTGNLFKQKKQLKSYTFCKYQPKNCFQQPQAPTPWAYNIQPKWIKPSHHVRYKF